MVRGAHPTFFPFPLLLQIHHGDAGVGVGVEFFYQAVVFQVVPQGAFETAGAYPVDDVDLFLAVEHRLVDEPVHQGQGLVYPEAHQVEAGEPGRGPVVAGGGAAPDGLAGFAPHRGDLLGADPELDASGLDLEAAVPGVNGQNIAGQAQGRQEDLLAGQKPGRRGRGRSGLRRQVGQQLRLAPGKLLAQLAPGLLPVFKPPDDGLEFGLGLLDAGQGGALGFVDQSGVARRPARSAAPPGHVGAGSTLPPAV